LRSHAKASSLVVAENLRLFVESLLQPTHFLDEARALLSDRALVELWWDVISGVQWQARFFRGIEKLKGQLEDGKARNVTYQYAGTDWEEVTALLNTSGGQVYSSYMYDDAGNQTSRCYGNSSPCGDELDMIYDSKDQLRRATKKAGGVVQGSE